MSNLLPLQSWEITSAREDFQAGLMTDTCAITRPTRSDNGKGMQSDSYGSAYAGLACALIESDRQPRHTEEGGRQVKESYWLLILPGGTAIKPNDRAVVNGLTYEVIEAEGDRTEALVCEVLVRRLKKP